MSQITASYAKNSVKYTLDVGENAAIDHERMLFTSLMSTHDKKEGIDAFINKRAPKFANK